MLENHAALAVLTASVTLQALTAIVALRLIPLTSHRLPWALMAAALSLMAVRRAIPLWHALSEGDTGRPADLAAEGLALAVTLVMLAAVWAIRPMFERIRRSEAAIRASERRYRQLFEAHRGVNLLLDASTGEIVEANPAAMEFYGASRDQLKRRTLASLSAEPDDAARADWARLAQHGDLVHDRHVAAHGDVKEVDVRIEPVASEHGEPAVLHAVVSDVTEQKATEGTLRAANEELRRWVIELERHRHDSEVHIELNALLQSCESLDEMGQVVGRLAPALFPDGSGALYLDDGHPGTLTCWVRWGGDAPPEAPFRSDECWAFRRGQMHITANARAGLLCPHLLDGYDGFSLCLPIRAHGGTPGLLTLRGSRRLQDTSGQRQARLMADTVGLAVVNLRLRDTLREQSTRDALTGLYNRRHLEETLARELARANRSADPVALLMVDLDLFKRINDTYGHTAGDRVLQSVAELLRRHVRAGDVVCRYGGEEFAVVMPGAGVDLALDRAEVLRRASHAVELPGPGPTRGLLSLSVGVAVFPQHARSAEDLVRCSDEALYAAKRAGRDRVSLPPKATAEIPGLFVSGI